MRPLEEIEYMADDDLSPEELARRKKISADKQAVQDVLKAEGKWPEERLFPAHV